MPDRIGLYLGDTYPIRDTIRFVQHAEARGFETIWQAENDLARDATIPMAAYATVTSRIKIGAGVMNIWTRNVATIAATFASLDDLATDRILCGLGTWHDPLASQVGIQRDRPLLAMREVIQALRGFFAGEHVYLQGQHVRISNIGLARRVDRQTRHIPIYIAATSSQMMALCGEIGDGILLNYMVSPEYTAAAIKQLAVGAYKSNRTLDNIDRVQLILCSTSRNREEALNRARRIVIQYIRQQPTLMRASGIRQELIDEVHQLIPQVPSASQITSAMYLISDEVVQLVTAAGTPEECRAKIREYINAGTTCPVLYPVGSDVNFIIDAFAYGYST